MSTQIATRSLRSTDFDGLADHCDAYLANFNSLVKIMGSGQHWEPQTPPRLPSLPFLLTNRLGLSPGHVEPYGRSLAIRQRVLDTVVDRFTSYRGLGRSERGDRPAARPPRVSANVTTAGSGSRIHSSPQVRQFTSTITATNHFHLHSADRSWSFTGGGRREVVSMPAIFSGSGSPATTAIKTPATSTASSTFKSLTKKLSAPQLSQSQSQPSSTSSNQQTSPSSTLTPGSLSRRLKPKGDNSNNHNNNNYNTDSNDSPADDNSRASIFRRLSPGLAARLKLLDGTAKNAPSQISRSKSAVGKIPEGHLRELDSQHQDLSIKIEKRGRAWTGGRVKRERSAPGLLPSPTTKDELNIVPPVPFPSAESTVTVEPPSLPDPIVPTPTFTEQLLAQLSTDAQVSDGGGASAMAAVESVMAPPSKSNGVDSTQGPTDLEEYLKRSTLADAGLPPPPPPKDTPPAASTLSSANAQSYFNPIGLHRTESIYSFSRASFSNQLSQLTSINLPQPSSLESSISSIATAPAAVKALNGAAEQIQKWINKASEVLNGLDAEDDVEWAAAGGREGLEDVDKSVIRFESLVNVYVKAIEEVQLRDDIANVTADDLTTIVTQMESTLKNWAQIRSLLTGVKAQVELAMEWEELWTVVLGDVGLEVDNLSRLIFEMEENRHRSLAEQPDTEPTSGLDINELETIVEESPFHGTPSSTKRFSLGPVFQSGSSFAATAANAATNPQDDANLMQLFARMQPLRASLDFLPMRLAMFQSRAEHLFPTACEELEDRRERLEKSYRKLEADAEALRRELGEDRWILVFRNAGRQAQKMCESVERSISKLQESLEAGEHVNNPTSITKKIESYEAKKIHYIPAIGRVMSIIQKGVNDRLTVNGEILTLLSDMKSRVNALKASMKVMDSLLEETAISRSQQLRDSISSIVSMDSPATGSAVGTPGSSPASSVILSGHTGMRGASTPNVGCSSRRASSVGSTARSSSNARKYSGLPQTGSTNLTVRKSSIPRASMSLSSPTSSHSGMSLTPTPASRASRRPAPTPISNKPRWNSSANTNDLEVGHSFRPLSVTTPSSYSKTPNPSRSSRSISQTSLLPVPSPLSRATSSSPVPGGLRTHSRTGSHVDYRPGSRLTVSPTPGRIKSPLPMNSVLDPPPYSKLRKQPSTSGMSNVPRSRQSYGGVSSTNRVNADGGTAARPGTALGHMNRRTSMLPQPKSNSGRDSAAGSRTGKLDERPAWR